MIVPIIIAALAIRSVRGAAYVGCVDPANIPTASGSTTGTDVTGCISYCSSQSSPYAFYSNADGSCTCSSSGAALSAYEASQDSVGSCAADQASAWYINTNYAFDSCGDSVTNANGGRTSFVASAEACLSGCTTATAVFGRLAGSYMCTCASQTTNDAPNACQGGQAGSGLYLYTLSSVEPTGVARRQLKERLRRAQAIQHQYCPAGLTACLIGSDREAFECVDTRADLESCGGCLGGLYGPTTRNATSTGVDCSALPNVALGGVTCTRGHCEVSACKYGYALVNKECVRML
ncbi:hypothetical protein I204_00537 [Kwoniella mangroviensis CBS 8886]|uniref:uncharacterized protein n=1 Tax=Kwoniella mangroviensis CBS 8507 TaxID=1296122 RepID=UPI00080CD31E|nr:uncharacterized protein I203_06826 [Kwoniella mangroviensis CBS 8507]OCF64242.1 hypothetical protein I203_06826 [Kwoniella mangroviensis CBS 8507]OCF78597.1 hypothetical protein I204_00537 [Kwoniella mangroviensis CBS 8886]